MHTEVSETSKKALLQELEEARSDVARLSSQNARAVGLETRLAMSLQEKDDIKQELDSATQRARMTESRIISYREKCGQCGCHNHTMRYILTTIQLSCKHKFRDYRRTSSHSACTDTNYPRSFSATPSSVSNSSSIMYVRRFIPGPIGAHTSLQQLGHAAEIHDAEVTKVLESLVADNEALKRDNAELQNLLAAEREELHTLQEELEERRASDTPFRRGHRFTHSGNSFTFHDTSAPLSPTFHVGTAPSASVLRSRLQSEKAATERRSLSVERSRERTSRRPFVGTTAWRPMQNLTCFIGAVDP